MGVCRILLPLLLCLFVGAASGASKPVYVVLWFDTEDFLDPRSDDAAKEVAERLTRLGVKATFKVVGEKARVLEERGRQDVIEALKKHDIGSHGAYHSLHPAPAEYLEHFDLREGADAFYARERQAVKDLARIFGRQPSCYGQPGSSFAPHKYLAFERLGLPVYFDSASHVSIDNQPFWYEGVLTVLIGGELLVRAELDSPPGIPAARQAFDHAYETLRDYGGGVISVVYHPTEFVNGEFWDAVNFSGGANPPPEKWMLPRPRPREQIERAYEVLEELVQYVKAKKDVEFKTVAEIADLYRDPAPGSVLTREEIEELAKEFQTRIDFARVRDFSLSAAEITGALLEWTFQRKQAGGESGVRVERVLAPTARRDGNFQGFHLSRYEWTQAREWTREFIQTNGRLPSLIFAGVHALPTDVFAATLAADIAAGFPNSPQVPIRTAICGFCERVSPDDQASFNWVIHPRGFRGQRIMEYARLLAWSIKPAVLQKR